MTESTTIRDVMVSNLLDHPSATMPALIEFGSEVPNDVTDAYAIVDRIIADERLHVALSTPPADDVREAVARISDRVFHSGYFNRPVAVVKTTDLRLVLDSLNAEVRPHGTVTDAEVKAAALCLGERFGHSGEHYVEDARAALEAAREVHP